MSSADAVLKAYDALEAAARAGSIDEAVDAVRPDLEVLSREDLLRVALVLAVEPGQRLVPRADRSRLLERLQRMRLKAMWAGSE